MGRNALALMDCSLLLEATLVSSIEEVSRNLFSSPQDAGGIQVREGGQIAAGDFLSRANDKI